MSLKIFTVQAKATHAEIHRVHVDVYPDPATAVVGESMTVTVLDIENVSEAGDVEITQFPDEACEASGGNGSWEDVRNVLAKHLTHPTLFEIV